MRPIFNHYASILLILLTVVSVLQAEPSDTLWTRTIGGTGDEMALCIQQTTDGGYILAGYTESMGAGGRDFWLVKTDSVGDTIWTNTYGGSGEEWGYCVDETSDQGFIMTGYTESFGSGGRDLWLIRTDSYGDTLWTKLFGGVEDDEGRYVEVLEDGFCVAGFTASLGAGAPDMWLIKTDFDGDSLWSVTFGGVEGDYCYSARHTDDGGFILVGTTWSFGAGEHDFYMVKTDSLGQMEWEDYYGANQSERYFDVCLCSSGEYLVTGYTWDWTPYSGLYLARTDESGNYIWNNIFVMDEQNEGWSLTETSFGNVLAAGMTGEYYGITTDMYIVETDLNGNLIWQERYGGNNFDACYSVIENADSNFIMAGYTDSYGAGAKDIWIVCLAGDETQPMGNLTIEAEPQNPPVIIPPEGGDFNFDISIACDSVGNASYDGWYNVVAPEGQVVGPMVLRETLYISANQIINREMNLYLSGWTQSGEYRLDAYVGIYPDTSYDSASFTFEKEALVDSDFGTAWACLTDGTEKERFALPCINNQKEKIGNVVVSPNPFNLNTTIQFQLTSSQHLKLIIYDVTGRIVEKLLDNYSKAGDYKVTFDGLSLASGIYFYQLSTNEAIKVGKLLLLK